MKEVEGAYLVILHSPGRRDDGMNWVVTERQLGLYAGEDIWESYNCHCNDIPTTWYTAHPMYYDETIIVNEPAYPEESDVSS
jgi:hypothetical protein